MLGDCKCLDCFDGDESSDEFEEIFLGDENVDVFFAVTGRSIFNKENCFIS
jgi:hypothetical protein